MSSKILTAALHSVEFHFDPIVSHALNAKTNIVSYRSVIQLTVFYRWIWYLFVGACVQHSTMRMRCSNVKLCVYKRNCLSYETNSKLILIQCKKSLIQFTVKNETSLLVLVAFLYVNNVIQLMIWLAVASQPLSDGSFTFC